MTQKQPRLKYPRKRIIRFLFRLLLKPLVRILFRVKIIGRKNFPRKGPLLVVGNHTGAMDGVLLNIFSPWQIEMLSAADIPAEKITLIIASLYGAIPLHRGSYDRAALETALDVLDQGGIVGIFPQGGIWEDSPKKAFPGITWLSYRAKVPVLPIGYNDTTGAMTAALKLKRPKLKMIVGQVLPPAQLKPGVPRKSYFQEYASGVMEKVLELVPNDDDRPETEIKNEGFEIELSLKDQSGESIPIPDDYQIKNSFELAKFLHSPSILSIFLDNLQLPVDPLQILHENPPLSGLILALQSILNYLNSENPYLLTYRFGVKGGLAMEKGLKELLKLIEWSFDSGHIIQITPIRTYYSPGEGREIVQREQNRYGSWM